MKVYFKTMVRLNAIGKVNRSVKLTFSPDDPVNTNVEYVGSGYLACGVQRSTDTPIGRQNMGTDSGRGNHS